MEKEFSPSYTGYIKRKYLVILITTLLLLIVSIYAINAGAARLTLPQIFLTLMGKASLKYQIIIKNIRLPRVLAAIVAGIGLSVAGCVMQNILRNPLASPFTLGISQGAAFGAAVAIVTLGAGSTQSSSMDAVIIKNPYMVTVSAFFWAMFATIVIILLARYRGASPETMILAGVALGSLFSAGTVLIQYFASDVEVASIVFWTFGDIGRASWQELQIMGVLTAAGLVYFLLNRWNYNALLSGEDVAKGLGVDVEKIRLVSMFFSSLIISATVSFLGIIGFIGLVGPHVMKRLIGGDYRFLIPASSVMGGLLLLASDTFGRTIISPVVLPVGAITSFMGAPLFLYLLFRGYEK